MSEIDENALPPIPDLKLAQIIFELSQQGQVDSDRVEKLIKAIDQGSLAPLYLYLHTQSAISSIIPWDQAKYDQYAAENRRVLDKIDAETKKAEEEEGEMEVLQSLRARSEYLAKICDYTKATLSLEELNIKTVTAGAKIDLLFARLRLALFFDKHRETSQLLDECQALVAAGGDWDRRNRLKAYKGVYLMSIRKFEEAAQVLLESISTFSSTELCSYSQIVQYAIITGLFTLPRTEIKSKIIDSPEILSLSGSKDMEDLQSCVNCLYLSDYASFFTALASVQGILERSRYLHEHAHFWVRELRLRAYNQLLQSYSSLSLSSMASSFNVTTAFLDADLAKFIKAGRIAAVINRIEGGEGGIVETKRVDKKDGAYRNVIAEGDKLLNKLQKYQNALVV